MDRRVEAHRVGHRLLLNYIDGVAEENPDKVAFTQVVSLQPESKHFTITYRHLSDLINRVAWWLAEECLGDRAKGSPIAYMGFSDIRHLILALAGVKTGFPVLLPSPRNSVPIHEHLIRKTGCAVTVFDTPFSAAAREVAENCGCKIVPVPDLVDLLSDEAPVKPYPYTDTFQNGSSKPIAIFHTSGTTGMPKPVMFAQGSLASNDGWRLLFSEESLRTNTNQFCCSVNRVYIACPLFHCAGLIGTFLWFLGGAEVVFGPPNRPPSLEMFKDMLHIPGIGGAFLPPLVVEEIANDAVLVEEVVPTMLFLAFAGGTLGQTVGDTLAQKTRLVNIIGTTECAVYYTLTVERENWEWLHFAEKDMGIHWEPVHPDGQDIGHEHEYYELVLRRDDSLPLRQPVFQNFPGVDVWHTKDLYSRHPTIPYYWKWKCRMDDVIVFSTGEKMQPGDLEVALNGLHGIHASLVVGHRRPYPILLLELSPAASQEDTMVAVHEAVEEINKQGLQYGKIHQKDILVASSDKPFARTAKGTINRIQTLKLYAAEIEALYASGEEVPYDEVQIDLDSSTDETLTRTLAQVVGGLTSVKEFGVQDDFFSAGLDSRQVQMLASSLTRVVHKDVLFLRNAVYLNPTAQGLVEYIRDHHSEDEISTTFDALYDRYSSAIPQTPKVIDPDRAEDTTHHVLLTGSTGFVGSFVLRSLMQRKDVAEVTCIDRRVLETPKSTGTTRVRRLKGDLSQRYFGLSHELYSKLVATVTEVIHCQWPVSFNLPLALFEPQISGVLKLIQLAHASPRDLRIIFLSSISTIQGWDQQVPVPELALDSLKYTRSGYGQAKMLASKLLQHAGLTSGVSSAICRVDQVAGPVRPGSEGVWLPRDWFPTLLRASEIMGCLPESLGGMDAVAWLPVDDLSEVLVDLTVQERGLEEVRTEYYHFSNPSLAFYEDLVPTISKRLKGCKTVSLPEWVQTLAGWPLDWESEAHSPAHTSMVAAIALLEFYQLLAAHSEGGSVRMDTSSTVAQIPRLLDVGPVNPAWMEGWLDQWGFGN